MFPAPFRVVLDANVLYPFTLRDTLLRSAAAGFFQAYWSAEILEEARRGLVLKSAMSEEKARSLFDAITGAFPEATVTRHGPLIAVMRNDEKDRHVAAAAVKAGAQVIVTANLKDFADLPPGIEAQSPDDFLCNLFDLDRDRVTDLVRRQAAALNKPPRSFEDVVVGLAKMVPAFAALLRDHAQEP